MNVILTSKPSSRRLTAGMGRADPELKVGEVGPEI